MNAVSKILAAVTTTLILAALATPASARECRSIYGGGEICENGNLEVRKEIRNPATSSWVNGRLESSVYNFKAGELIEFQFVVRNTSDVKVNDIKVDDKVSMDPITQQYLEFVSADPNGHWDGGNNTVWFDHFDLDKNSEKVLRATFRVKPEGNLNNGTVCIPDRVEVRAEDDTASAESLACIKKGTTTSVPQVLGVTTLPSTGPMVPVALAVEVLGFAGLGAAYLAVSRKYSK